MIYLIYVLLDILVHNHIFSIIKKENMANIMTSNVCIKNLKETSFKKIVELFELSNSSKEIKTHIHLNKLFNENFSEDEMSISWMNENVGCKNLNITFLDSDKFSTEINFTIESASNLPEPYLKKLINYLTSIDDSIVIIGTYIEEDYDNVGAFIYAKEDYEDTEDLYPEVDIERMSDEEYRNETFQNIIENRDSLYEGYQERLREQEEDEDASNAVTGDLEIELYFWDNTIVTEHEGKTFISFVADLTKASFNRVINKHSKIGMTANLFPMYFEENTLKLNLELFKNFEKNKAIQSFITIGTKLPEENRAVNWISADSWGIENNHIIEFAKDFYLLINEINDGGCEKLAQIRWQVINSFTNKSDDYEVNIYIDTKTKEIRAESSIGY